MCGKKSFRDDRDPWLLGEDLKGLFIANIQFVSNYVRIGESSCPGATLQLAGDWKEVDMYHYYERQDDM